MVIIFLLFDVEIALSLPLPLTCQIKKYKNTNYSCYPNLTGSNEYSLQVQTKEVHVDEISLV